MQHSEIEKSKPYILIGMVEYIPGAVAREIIVRKTTGNICIVACDTGKVLADKISPFDTFIQVIEGIAEVVIDDKSNLLQPGQAIIVPAHTPNMIKANERFKMISTVIKSGYEDNTI